MEDLLTSVASGTLTETDATPLKKLGLTGRTPVVYIREGILLGHYDRSKEDGSAGPRFVGKDCKRFREILEAGREMTGDKLIGIVALKGTACCRKNTNEVADKDHSFPFPYRTFHGDDDPEVKLFMLDGHKWQPTRKESKKKK